MFLCWAIPAHGQGELAEAQRIVRQGPASGPAAVALLEKHLQQNPKDETALRLLARIQMQTGQFEAAIATIDRAIGAAGGLHRRAPGMEFLRADCLFRLGRISEAMNQLEICRSYYEADPDRHWQFLDLWNTVARKERSHDSMEIPISVSVHVKNPVVRLGEPIPVDIAITNQLQSEIGFSTISLVPTETNGETLNISLVDVYRNNQPRGLFLARPTITESAEMQASPTGGRKWHRIAPGEVLRLSTDVRKWSIVDGWIAGKYTITLAVEGITADDRRCHLRVMSEPFTFELR
jgi:tetratricopeptide (TPR) repeat protein